MQVLELMFSPRFIVLTLCIAVTALLVCGAIYDPEDIILFAIPIAIFGSLSVLGIHDLLQKSHAVLRNYPISRIFDFAGGNPARDAAILFRKRKRRQAL
jgi:hypothetical protein